MKAFITDFNQILTEVSLHFDLVGRMEEAERIVLWNDVDIIAPNIMKTAHRYKIPVTTVQHGRWGTSRYYPPFNQKIISDRYCAWGEADKKRLIKAGNDPKRIIVTGTPVFEYLKGRKPHEGINIVFSPEHWDKEIPENVKVAKALRRLANKHKFKITTKIIEGHDSQIYDNPIYSSRKSNNHLSTCADVLSTADLVVGISESTFEFLAQALDIPVVIYSKWEPKICARDKRYLTYERMRSNAAKHVYQISKLEEAILQQLKNPDELKAERAIVCEKWGSISKENPVEEIVKAIETCEIYS